MVARKIKYTSVALSSIDSISRYIGKRHGLKSKKEFKSRLLNSLELITQSPDLWPVFEYKWAKGKVYRKAIVHGLTIILYTYDDKNVYIEVVVDARTDWQ